MVETKRAWVRSLLKVAVFTFGLTFGLYRPWFDVNAVSVVLDDDERDEKSELAEIGSKMAMGRTMNLVNSSAFFTPTNGVAKHRSHIVDEFGSGRI